MRVTVYGPGGYDPDLPNDNIVEEYEVPDPPATETAVDPAMADFVATLTPAQRDALTAALAAT